MRSCVLARRLCKLLMIECEKWRRNDQGKTISPCAAHAQELIALLQWKARPYPMAEQVSASFVTLFAVNFASSFSSSLSTAPAAAAVVAALPSIAPVMLT